MSASLIERARAIAVTCVMAVGLTLSLAPGKAAALNNLSNKASNDFFFNCLRLNVPEWRCNFLATVIDPIGLDITDFSITYAYDPTKFVFDPTLSGPLGAFSTGGDAPPVSGGVGTEALKLLPATGFEPGAPLPGSTLTYIDTPGLLAVTYHLGSPVTATEPANFFRLGFRFIDPVVIDITKSTVTYDPVNPGLFTQQSFACTTTDGANACGSDHPSTGISFKLSVPEPASWTTMILGVLALGAALRLRRPAHLA